MSSAEGSVSTDMTAALDLLTQIKDKVIVLGSLPASAEGIDSKERMRRDSLRLGNLLHAAHLANRLHVEILTQYHGCRGPGDHVR